MKVLVIQQKMIGDVLASTVICEALKMEYPHVEIHYMIHHNTKPVIDNNPFIDHIIQFDPQKIKGLRSLRRFGKSLMPLNFDAVIDAYGKWESVIPAYFSGAPIRIGFSKWYTDIFYTKSVIQKPCVEGSAIFHRLQLAEAFIGKFPPIVFPKIFLGDSEISQARENLDKIRGNSKVIMISVLGSDVQKSLPPMQMAAMLDHVVASGNVILLFNFIPVQKEAARAIYDLCMPETKKQIVFDFYMKGLRPFLAVMSQCDALVGNEGGAVNMAKALGIPTFTLFSPWINKSSWNMLTSDGVHVAIHLQDYFPELYGAHHPGAFKNKSGAFYKKLTLRLYQDSLTDFLQKIIL